MNQLEAMRIYLRVAETGSFTRAAEDLGLPKSSVSQAVRHLEGLLGSRLLHRTTRRVRPTQDGQVYYERCKDLLADLEELQGLFRSAPADLRGRLRVDMPVGTAYGIVIPRLPEFLARHPGIEIELSATDRRVDVVSEGFDCVLRAGPVDDSSLVARPLGGYRQINCASAGYLAERGTPRGLADLAGHRLVHYADALGDRDGGFEYLDAASGETRRVAMAGRIAVNNSDAYRAACLAGLGIIQAPDFGLRPYLDQGSLVEILPDYRPAPLPVTLLYGNRRHVAARTRVFMAWLEEIMRPHLAGRPAPD
ncbi:LysR family transcriptional regulator [Parasulfuritortus cantonensis]|uniref:LysR family transcriptional regulator n=1 Tax=Parasulfuritortus cantonensis TaxID=2528202 RepID=A0A4R1BD06_9PROT|nr:LysR family transcriptional regulator [Parasulfuritortus cantonensis]TCJ14904.1 LysR family transcriptional regulator [Parasulfuritortus cantonensis]